MPTDLQRAALNYLHAGLHLLALTGKKPNGRVHGDSWSWEASFHGHACTQEEFDAVLDAFSEAKGTTGIAILIPRDVLVADVDSERAADLLYSLGFEVTDETIDAKTKNGHHLWFWYPGADRNRWLGDGKQPDPSRTLLFKGLGGYVVAPPSLHFGSDGEVDGSYEWVLPLVVAGELHMPPILPVGVRERFKADDQFTDTQPDKAPMTHHEATPVVGKRWWEWPVSVEYVTEGLERAIIEAADGNQNNVIHWAAMVCRDEGVPEDIAMDRLMAAAKKGNHPESRARDTIRGAYKRAPRV